jgi:hypothetical protein
MNYLRPVLLLSIQLFSFRVKALPNVTVTRTGQGDCSAYPSFYGTNGRTADAFIFLPSQVSNPSLNNLHTGIVNSTLVAFSSNTTIDSTIFCCASANIMDGWMEKSLLLSNDRQIGYRSEGMVPETYTQEVDGVKQEGVFLGYGNVTTWGFRRGNGGAYWNVRLVSEEQIAEDEEFRGFLKAVLPPSESARSRSYKR